MKTHRSEIRLSTSRRFEIADITADVASAVEASGISEGFVLVYTPHTTTAIRVNEKEERLHQDVERFLRELAPPEKSFRHDADTVDGRPNAWGHIVSMLMGVSASIPVHLGKMEGGGWQSVFFVELDGPRKDRKALVRVFGE